MVAGENAGDDVRSEDGGEDIRWTHPDALRAAVLTANGVRARARWETKQGIDYATFRFALKDASGAKLRRAPSPPVDGARERSPSRAAFDTPGRDAGQTRRGFEPALLVAHAGPVDAENAKTATLQRFAAPRVARWSRGSEREGEPTRLALGRADGSVSILAAREASVVAKSGAPGVGYRLDAARVVSLGDAERNKNKNDAPIVDVDWSAAGDRLVTACEAGDVRVWSRCVGAHEDDASETWRCSRVVACGDDERVASSSAGTAGTAANESRVGSPRLPAAVAARFHPLNADLFFVALSGARSVWAVNASTGRVSARLEASARSVPADLSAACVDAVGAFVYAGDTEGRVLALRYTRADETPVFPKRAAFTSLGGRVFAARRSLRVPAGGSRNPRNPESNPESDPSTSPSTSAVPKRANAFVGEHAVSFAGSAAPPSAFPRGSLGTEIAQVAYAPFARVAGGAAVFATFRCGAVRAYKTTFGESTRVHGALGAKRNAFPHSARVAASTFTRTRRRGALTPALTVSLPAWPGVSRHLSAFVAIAPTRDPHSAAECAASVAGGGAATYALPSVDGAPPARSGALAAANGTGDKKPVAVCAAFDGAGETLVVGYEDGGVLLWKRTNET